MKRCAPLLAALLWLALAAPANAGRIFIDFDFSGSTLSVLGGAIIIPPDGSITSSTATLDVTAAGVSTATGVAPGLARFRDLTLAGTVSASVLGNVITGGLSATQLGSAIGTLTAGLNTALFASAFQLGVVGTINCVGAGCGILGLPLTLNSLGPAVIGTLPVGNINSIGNATINAAFSLTLGGITAVLNLVGTEVNRTYVPEPNTLSLMALGVAGIAAIRRQRRLQR